MPVQARGLIVRYSGISAGNNLRQRRRSLMGTDWVQKLVKDGLVAADQVGEATAMASNLGIKLEAALIKLEYCTQDDIRQAQAAQFGYEFVNLDAIEISPAAIAMLPESMARENIVCPVAVADEGIRIAISDPMRTSPAPASISLMRTQ